MMHNGRIFKEGKPAEIEDDREVQALYLGGPAWLIAVLEIQRGLQRLLRPVPCASGRRPDPRHGVLSVVGRNGMGKTTLCKAIMGLVPVAQRIDQLRGRSLVGLTSRDRPARHRLCAAGRRLWRSLTVDEHLLVARRGGAVDAERIYSTFPRLAERRSNGGGQLSGGEQQMLAIGRALLLNPKLLVMDEPTEGLAPVIVSRSRTCWSGLRREGDIHVLVIEQNIGVACAVSEQVGIMVNGRINRVMDAGPVQPIVICNRRCSGSVATPMTRHPSPTLRSRRRNVPTRRSASMSRTRKFRPAGAARRLYARSKALRGRSRRARTRASGTRTSRCGRSCRDAARWSMWRERSTQRVRS